MSSLRTLYFSWIETIIYDRLEVEAFYILIGFVRAKTGKSQLHADIFANKIFVWLSDKTDKGMGNFTAR